MMLYFSEKCSIKSLKSGLQNILKLALVNKIAVNNYLWYTFYRGVKYAIYFNE